MNSIEISDIQFGPIVLWIAALTCEKINEKQEELKQCKWTDGESNTDTDFSTLACNCVKEIWGIVQEKYPQLDMITVVADIPDINLTFLKNEHILSKNKIELKSCKKQTMPGSTIKKLDINQPLIYCYRPKNADEKYEVRYGQYHTAMVETDHDKFQDRSPRPPINFTNLSVSYTEINYVEKQKDDWIVHYAVCAVNRIKHNVPESWQDPLIKRTIYEYLKDAETLEDFIKLRDSVKPI